MDSLGEDDFVDDVSPPEAQDEATNSSPDPVTEPDPSSEPKTDPDPPQSVSGTDPIKPAEAPNVPNVPQTDSERPSDANPKESSATVQGMKVIDRLARPKAITSIPKRPNTRDLNAKRPATAASTERPPRPPPMRPSTITHREDKEPVEQGTSIMTYNPALPARFRDPFTIEAMRLLGILVSDIEYPSEATLKMYSHDPEFRSIARKELCAQVDELIEQIKQKREQLRKQAKEQKSARTNQTRPASPSKEENGFLEAEQKRLDRMSDVQRRDMENILLGVMIKSEEAKADELKREREAQIAKEREAAAAKLKKDVLEAKMRRQQELERHQEEMRKKQEEERIRMEEDAKRREKIVEEERMKKKRNAEEEEKKRLEKIENAARNLAQIQEERRKEYEKKDQEAQKREIARQKKLEEEQKRMAEIREQRKAYMEDLIRRTRLAQLEQIEKRRKEAEEKDKKSENILKRHEESLVAKRKEIAEREEKKAKVAVEVRQKIAEEWRESAKAVQEKEIRAAIRVQEVERKKKEKCEESRRSFDETLLKKQDEKRKQQEIQNEKNRELTKQQDERLVEIQKQRDLQERQRAKQAMIDRLARERKKSAAFRAERQREAEKLEVKVRYDAHIRRIEENAQTREHARAIAAMHQKKLGLQREEMVKQLDAFRMKKGDDELFVRQVAANFGINFEDLKRKLEERKMRKSPSLLPSLPELAPVPNGQEKGNTRPVSAERGDQNTVKTRQVPNTGKENANRRKDPPEDKKMERNGSAKSKDSFEKKSNEQNKRSNDSFGDDFEKKSNKQKESAPNDKRLNGSKDSFGDDFESEKKSNATLGSDDFESENNSTKAPTSDSKEFEDDFV